jgi:hypothetical protein
MVGSYWQYFWEGVHAHNAAIIRESISRAQARKNELEKKDP